MSKKWFSIFAVICCMMLVVCGCSANPADKVTQSSDSASSDVSSPEPEPITYYNNLTGLYELDSKEKEDCRPMAVMINNITVAQKVQTGLGSASVVYETFAEGGITRLLAVFKDPSQIETLGSLRSARYSFIDLACGHDAIYVHAGLDPNYTKSRMSKLGLDNYDLNSGYGADYNFRVKNGLAWEHTMFTNGELLNKAMTAGKRRTTVKDNYKSAWLNFADEDTKIVPDGEIADKVSVFFSGSYITKFNYDAESGRYLKFNRDNPNIDEKTGKQYSYKNVLVLFTKVGMFDDNYRVYSEMKGGEGYYISNGKYVPILWEKGDTYNPLKIKAADGSAITVNAGNTYVCITNVNNRSKTTIG